MSAMSNLALSFSTNLCQILWLEPSLVIHHQKIKSDINIAQQNNVSIYVSSPKALTNEKQSFHITGPKTRLKYTKTLISQFT